MYTYKNITKLSDYEWEVFHSSCHRLLQRSPFFQIRFHPDTLVFKNSLSAATEMGFQTLVLYDEKNYPFAALHYMMLPPIGETMFYMFAMIEESEMDMEKMTAILSKMFNNVILQTAMPLCRITTHQQTIKNVLSKMKTTNAISHDISQVLNFKRITSVMEQCLERGMNFIRDKKMEMNTYQFLPESLLPAYIAFHNEQIKDIPYFSEKENGIIPYTPEILNDIYQKQQSQNGNIIYLLLTSADNKIIGLTEAWLNGDKNAVSEAYSGLTAIAPAYRQNGLATFLKIKMMQYLQEHYPEIKSISTNNSIKNDAILAVNQKLGYVPVSEEYVFIYK